MSMTDAKMSNNRPFHLELPDGTSIIIMAHHSNPSQVSIGFLQTENQHVMVKEVQNRPDGYSGITLVKVPIQK